MNDQHQEYVDAATRAAFTGEAGHETRGPGAAIRARIGAQALREAAAEAERDADHCPEGCQTRHCRETNLTAARWLRAEADRLLHEVGIPHCTATSIQGYTCLHPTGHTGPHEARPTVIRWTDQ